MNIYISLPLPTHTVINFSLIPAPLADKSARAIEERAAREDVRRAVNAYLYA